MPLARRSSSQARSRPCGRTCEDGSILARHKGLYALPGGEAVRGPGDIPPGLWTTARFDPATGRVILATAISSLGWDGPLVARKVFAVEIELERAAVEALWPVKPKPPRRHAAVRSRQLPGRRSSLTSTSWSIAQGPFPSLGSARDSVKLLLRRRRSLANCDDRTVERWINKHRPHWVTGGVIQLRRIAPYCAAIFLHPSRALCRQCPRQHGAFRCLLMSRPGG